MKPPARWPVAVFWLPLRRMRLIGNILAALLLAGGTVANCWWIGRHTPQPELPAPPADTLRHARLLFAGDLMQHMAQINAARSGDGFDYAQSFAWVAERFRRADLAVVNLETTLTRSKHYTGYPCFRAPVAVAEEMARMGVDVALLANNHCCDGGARGIATTVEVLDSLGIVHAGAFPDSADYRRSRIVRLNRGSIRFALLNYTYGTNGLPTPRGCIVRRIDTLDMARDLADARRDSAECIIVCMHWGNEYERRENDGQRRLAGFLRRHGADLIIGSHPHVIQPCEADSTHITLYSLGNFVSNQQRRYCDGGLLAEIEVTRYPSGRCTYRLATLPVWVLLPGYRIVPPEVGDTLTLPPAVRARYQTFLDDTRQLLELSCRPYKQQDSSN